MANLSTETATPSNYPAVDAATKPGRADITTNTDVTGNSARFTGAWNEITTPERRYLNWIYVKAFDTHYPSGVAFGADVDWFWFALYGYENGVSGVSIGWVSGCYGGWADCHSGWRSTRYCLLGQIDPASGSIWAGCPPSGDWTPISIHRQQRIPNEGYLTGISGIMFYWERGLGAPTSDDQGALIQLFSFMRGTTVTDTHVGVADDKGTWWKSGA